MIRQKTNLELFYLCMKTNLYLKVIYNLCVFLKLWHDYYYKLGYVCRFILEWMVTVFFRSGIFKKANEWNAFFQLSLVNMWLYPALRNGFLL